MKSWIRIDYDEDQELLKNVTLGPAIKEYVDALPSVDMGEFILDLEEFLWKIWAHQNFENNSKESDLF